MKLAWFRFASAFLLLGGATAAVAKIIASDLSAPDKRRTFVGQAMRLATPEKPAPLSADLAVPFNPAGFEQTEAQERSLVAAQGGGVPRVVTDRDTLEEIASRIAPGGSIRAQNGEPMLTFAQKTFKAGTRFKVELNGQEYDLELIRIDPTTFTLRLNSEEITRPIKPAKSP